MQKTKENGISHLILFSAHYIRESYFVCCLFCTCPLCFWAAFISQKKGVGGVSRDQNDVTVFVPYLNFQIKWTNFY
jgi:hypothetical protein